MLDNQVGFLDFFKNIPDHRINRRKLHTIEEILLVIFSGIIAGCDSWNDIEFFGKTKIDLFRQIYPYKNGIASDDTFRRFFRTLNPELFEKYFIAWVKSFGIELYDKVVALDGKTSRRSFDGEGKPLHIVSAFVSELGITLGQLKTKDKSNEITAIPELLELLDIDGAIVTIDAMGCQTKIVEKILEKKANYLISLKGNQGTLNDDVRLFFEAKPKGSEFLTRNEVDKGHGRIEKRECTASEDIEWLRERHPNWSGLNSVIEITSQREIKEKITTEKRYYISSMEAEPEKILSASRSHWGIENKLHWVLDVSFNDDQCRIRKGNAPRNIAVIKKVALNLLQVTKQQPEHKRKSLKGMRKLAGWDNSFLLRILTAKLAMN